MGISVALGFPLGLFGGVLEGLQKFYVNNWISVISRLLRAALIVFYLSRGYGLLIAALITVGLPLLASFLRAAMALRAIPVSFSWDFVERPSATWRTTAASPS